MHSKISVICNPICYLFKDLSELNSLLEPKYKNFFEVALEDMYPGCEVRDKRVTKILPSHNVAMLMPHQRYDDDLNVTWQL